MENKKNHIIKTKDLSIGYSSKKEINTIASNLNIEVSSGKFICLLGQNGIGKSTLLRTLTKVQPELNGEIEINGVSIAELTNLDLAKSLSLVLTERLPENNLSVFELVALGRQPHTNWIGYLTSEDLKIIHDAFKKTHTKHLMDMKYYELSDGQLQKVLIARALTQDTSIIILDEPTAHLDIHHTIETFSLLKKLAEELGKTIIVSTHEINLALQLAHELWLMTPEKLVTGKTADLIKNDEINELFHSELIKFDKASKQFIISNS